MTQPQTPQVLVHPGLSPGAMRLTVAGALLRAGTDEETMAAFNAATENVKDRAGMVKAMKPWAIAVWGTQK